MKNVLKVLGIFALFLATAFTIISCDKEDDPTDLDFFAGTYNGAISYTEGTNNITTNTGKVFVTKIASNTKYNFAFSDNIPDINGVEFNREGEHVLVMIGSNATAYIRIENGVLKMFYTKDGKTWTADCTR